MQYNLFDKGEYKKNWSFFSLPIPLKRNIRNKSVNIQTEMMLIAISIFRDIKPFPVKKIK